MLLAIFARAKQFFTFPNISFWPLTWRWPLQLVHSWQQETSVRDWFRQNTLSLPLFAWKRFAKKIQASRDSLTFCLRDSTTSQFSTLRRNVNGFKAVLSKIRSPIKLKTSKLTTRWFAKRFPSISNSPWKSTVSLEWWLHLASSAFKSTDTRRTHLWPMLTCLTIVDQDRHRGLTATRVKDSLLKHLKTFSEASRFMIHMGKSATHASYSTMALSIWTTTVMNSLSSLA